MDVVITHEGLNDTVRGWHQIHRYNTKCDAKACNYCTFRYRCYTDTELEIDTDELESLSLRYVSGNELQSLIHEKLSNKDYYSLLFHAITRERNAQAKV